MKKLLNGILGLFISYVPTAYAGLPPTTLKGQSETSPVTTFNFQAPYSTATTNAGSTRYLDSGNRNLLLNSSFEASTATTSWTATTATGSSESTIVTDGKKSYHLAFSASTGNMAQSVTPVIQMDGNNLEYSCKVKTSLSTIQVCALNAGTEIACNNVTPSSGWAYVPVNSPGPASGSVGVEVKTSSSTTGDVYIDDCYVGPARNVSSVAQASFYGSLKYPGATSCDWTTSSSSYSDFAADTDCVTPTVVGNAVAPGTKIPAVAFNNMPPGNYLFNASFPHFNSTGGGGDTCQFIDDLGTVITNQVVSTASSNDVKSVPMSGTITYTAPQSSRTFKLQCRTGSGTHEIDLGSGASFRQALIEVYYYPASSQLAVNTSQGNIDWTAYTPTLSAGFGTATNVSFLYSRQGSNLNVRGTFTTGTVTTGLGTITLPTSLVIDSTKMSLANTSGNPGPSIGRYGQNGAADVGPMVTALGTSTSLVYLGGLFSGTSMNTPAANTNGVLGSTQVVTVEFSVPIVGWVQTQNAPLLVGSVTTNSTGADRIERLHVASACTSTPCTITSQSGGFTSVTRSATGTYSVNYPSSNWSVAPACVWMLGASSGPVSGRQEFTTTTTQMQFLVFDNVFARADAAFDVICMGPR